MEKRPPIVVILGHVDHGKSSLLEAIREDFRITSKESGGITQHIGAYVAEYQGKPITFIDTPGHEAFSAMRSRGAKVADLAVLVIAADDGVKPQTKEAIVQIKQAKLPVIVVLNKIDAPGAHVEKVKQELAQEDIYVESYGGKIPSVETSALTKQGITELLEMILLVAEVEDLSADSSAKAQGLIIESSMDSQRGISATLLVTNGTLRKGDIAGTRSSFGKIRIMEDFQGQAQEDVSPSFPALVVGFSGSLKVGEEFRVFESEAEAQAFVVPQEPPASFQGEDTLPAFNIVLKADVLGSLEAVEEMLVQLPQDKIRLRIVDSGAGDVIENDVKVARGAGAVIFAFRSKANSEVASLALREEVPVETFQVIYELIQRVRLLMEESLAPETTREELGELLVLQVFRTDKNRQIVGGRVTAGVIRKARVEVKRGEDIVGKGRVMNVQRNKQEAQSVSKGEEGGVLYEGAERVQEGDVLLFFAEETKKGIL